MHDKRSRGPLPGYRLLEATVQIEGILGLTRFRGHLIAGSVWARLEDRVHATNPSAVSTGVSP
jgi:hypothetical protein